MNYLTLEERFNKEGVCVERKINGEHIPNDNHPSVEFLAEDIKQAKWVKTISYMTKEQAETVYGYKKN